MMIPEPGDNLEKETIIEEWDNKSIIKRAIEYPTFQTKELYYPAKSYAIATLYAILLTENFGGEPLDYLKDPELLAGNDPYFKPYDSSNEDIYSIIWSHIFLALEDGSEKTSENFNKSVQYFYEEFLLAENTRVYLPPDER